MPELDPRPEAAARLQQTLPASGALWMLNLLRYREQAAYPPDSPETEGPTPRSGRDSYAHYSSLVQPHLRRVGGRPLFKTAALFTLIGPAGEDWHDCLLVRYPSRAAFIAMTSDPDFQKIARHRRAALADSRLIVLAEGRTIGRLVWWLIGLLARLRRA
ncbi:MAG: DUF1330 domain-containing protein [Lysobacterales bacterium]